MTYALSPLVNAVIIVLVLLPASSLSNAHEARVFLVGRRFPLTVSGARKKAHGRQQWAPMLPMIMSRGGKAECKLVSWVCWILFVYSNLFVLYMCTYLHLAWWWLLITLACDGLIPEKQKQVSGSFLSRSWKVCWYLWEVITQRRHVVIVWLNNSRFCTDYRRMKIIWNTALS